MRDRFIATLKVMAEKDPSIMLVTGDLGFSVLDQYRKDCANQFINAGIAEQMMTGMATGLAMTGHKVFTYSIANFTTLRCLEQIRNDACYHEANVNVVSVGGGFSYGQLGMSHHATEDLSFMRSMPLTLVAPSCLWEVEEATKAIALENGTSYLRLDKSVCARAMPKDSNEKFVLGRPRVLQSGKDVTFICSGGIAEEAFLASDILQKKYGIAAEILSVHTLNPLDPALIFESVKRTGHVVTVEENTVSGGLGGLVAETLMEAGIYPKKFMRVGMRSGFSSVVGDQAYLRKYYGLDADALVRVVEGQLMPLRLDASSGKSGVL